MKIMHIACLNKARLNSGVLNQMEAEYVSAQRLNLNWTSELWTTDEVNSVVNRKLKIVLNNFFTRRLAFFYELKKALSANDIVIMRNMPLDFLSLFLPKYQKQKLIIYFHAKEESILTNKNLKGKIFHIINEYINKIILKNIWGVAAVTNDLLSHYLVKSEKCDNFYTYPNGILLDKAKIDEIPENTQCVDTIKIAFIATHFYKWNGLEYLLQDIVTTNTDTPFQLILVGAINDAQREMIENCQADIVQYDYLDSEEILNELRGVNVTLGAFNLESVGLNEGCT